MNRKKKIQNTLSEKTLFRQKRLLSILTGVLTLSGILTITQMLTSGTERVTEDLIVLYDFQEGNGNTVTDVSGVGSPLNLTIENTDNVSWLEGGGISIDAATIVESSLAATKITDAVKGSEEISMEAWVICANTSQGGPARILTLSKNGYERNFTLAQDKKKYQVRLRTNDTHDNGTPDFKSPNKAVNASMLQHIVYTRDKDGDEKLYVDGSMVASDVREGDFDNWDTSWRFALANELTQDRSWLGEIHLAAIYEKALSSEEVGQNYQHGVENFDYFAAAAGPLPGATVDGWETFEESTAYQVDILGTGIPEGAEGGSGTTFVLAIPNPENVSHILVETISKSGSVDITYTTALGSVAPGSTAIPKAGTTSSNSFQVHRSLLTGDPSVNEIEIETSDSDKSQSVTAMVFRTGTGIEENSTGIYVQEWFYKNSNTYNFTIPTAASARDLTITIPVSEMSNDGRLANFSATAGSVSVSETINTYDPALGQSLRMVTLVLADVPGEITSVSVTAESPSSNGDSFAIGGAIEMQSRDVAAAFPVEWIGFSAEAIENAALLKWSTAAEINSDYYIVERSTDGKLYQQMGTVKAAGMADSPTEYQFEDDKINGIPTPSVLYRLRQVDIDGSFSYSTEVELKLNQAQTLRLNAFPNPVSEVLNISYTSKHDGPLDMKIINLSGQTIDQRRLPFTPGGGQLQLAVQNWAKGIYIIHLTGEVSSKQFQFVVK